MMDEQRFWSMIEEAWKSAGDGGAHAAARKKLAQGKLSEEGAEELVVVATDEIIPALQAALQQLSREDLLAFDRILERKLYDIDRSDVQEQTDGSDDGFLYARGFIVAAGKGYYDSVNADLSRAMMDMECEDLCYLPVRVYQERFGEMPPSDISRESASNPAGWREEEE